MRPVQVVGAGGIGSAIGYALLAAKTPVVFIEANEKKVVAGQRDGVRVDDRPALDAEFVHFEDWKPTTDSPILLCTKCYDNAAVLAKLPPDADLIPIQNGFDPKLHAFGHEWEGIASFVSECEPDRPHTRITRKGDLHIGRRSLSPRPPLPGGGGERECPSPPGRGWGGGSSASSKSPTSTRSSTPSSCTTPRSRHSPPPRGSTTANSSPLPEARELFFALLQENYRILTAAGIALGKVGPFHPRTVAWILRRKWLAGIMAKCFEPSLRGTYCSMAGEIQKGRTEIDNYNGHLIRLAEADRHALPAQPSGVRSGRQR